MTTRTSLTAAAVAALLAASAHAQQTGTEQAEPAQDQQTQVQTDQETAGQGADQPSGMAEGQAQGQGADPLVATVGDARITGADVMAVIDTLPPQLRQQPPQLLVPMAVDSLVLRALVLGEARAQNLAEDPEVQALVDA